ncbi:MAG: PilZ domain-containing protein [Thermodesulfobacteriota bacterium]
MSVASIAESADGPDRIGRKGLFNLFGRLKEERIPIQFTVFGRDYERLSLITGIKRGDDGGFVLIDSPTRLREDLPECDGLRVKVEFLDKDRIQYAFRSRIARVSGEDIWLVLPEFVERIQRRRYFRIAPPVGTKISFIREGKPLQASVVNLSEGGALLSFGQQSGEGPRLWPGEELHKLHLRCPGERVSVELGIRKAVVRRSEKNPQTHHPTYACQFLDMDSKDRHALQVFIFQCQREMLQKRSLMEDG